MNCTVIAVQTVWQVYSFQVPEWKEMASTHC